MEAGPVGGRAGQGQERPALREEPDRTLVRSLSGGGREGRGQLGGPERASAPDVGFRLRPDDGRRG